MANVQKYLEEFHKRIRLNIDENRLLREKRDIIIDKVIARLPGILREAEVDCPFFEFRNQGSYQMGTGTLPVERDFDIDLGLYLQIDPDAYHAVDMKRLVHRAVQGHTPEVLIRRPCVTVQYRRLGRATCHVDIAVYSDGSLSRDGLPRLAMGKNRSGEEFCVWEVSDASALSKEIFGSYSGDELRQFRRVVRYLKRWKDERFVPEGNAAPRGIALTVASHEHFAFTRFRDGTPDDLGALIAVVRGIMESFSVGLWARIKSGGSHEVKIILPVEPHTDLCERMTVLQMRGFYEALEDLMDSLKHAARTRREEKACALLSAVFGQDFPGPDSEVIDL